MSISIFFPCIHAGLTKNIAKICKKLGYTLVLPSEEYKPKIRPQAPVKDFVWNEGLNKGNISKYESDNIELVSYQELLDCPPDIIFITNYESQFEILNNVWPHVREKSKLAYYSGNVYWPGAYNIGRVKNYLSADSLGMFLGKNGGVKNLSQFLPLIEHDNPLTFTKESFFGSYINDYESNFSDEFNFVKQGVAESGVNYEMCDNMPNKQIILRMEESLATIHIKRTEGLGLSIIESLSCGRPIILHKKFASTIIGERKFDMTYMKWCRDSESAIFVDSMEGFIKSLKRIESDDDFRYSMQEKSYNIIREELNEQKVLDAFRNFINNCQ